MPNATSDATKKQPVLAIFAAAIATAAATFGILAVARQCGRSLFVAYQSPLGGTVHTEPASRPTTALHRFERAVQQDLTYSLDEE